MNGHPDAVAMLVHVRILGLATAAALTVGLSAGCGGSAKAGAAANHPPASGGRGTPAGSSTPAATHETCVMLTSDQVAAALGEAPGPGKPEPNFDAPGCEWEPASGHNGTVTLEVGPWEGDPGVKPLKLGTPVAGVGDEAYDAGGWLYVRKGGNGLGVWVFNVNTQSSQLEMEKQLAGIVLGEM
jgi:hypothetical protein